MKSLDFLTAICQNSVSFNHKRVLEALDYFTNGDTDKVLSIMAYITGFTQKPDVPYDPVEGFTHPSAILQSYDFWSDKVTYSYIETNHFYVTEDLKQFDQSKFADWYDEDLQKIRKSKGDHLITVFVSRTGTTTLQEWTESSRN